MGPGVVAAGRWATCVAAGRVGLGAPPVYPIGVNAIFGTNRIGAMMRRILELHRVVSPANIDTAAFAAMDAARPYDTAYWTKEQRDVNDLHAAIAGSIHANPNELGSAAGRDRVSPAVEIMGAAGPN